MFRWSLLIALFGLPLLAVPTSAQSSSDGPAASETTITPGGRRAERNVRRGVASYYARYFHGRRTASGEVYNHNAMTVAHKSLPFGTILRVEDVRSGRRIMVRVNDRGPFVRGRVLDFSGAAADKLQMRSRGTARVDYEIVDPATLPSRRTPPPRKVRHF